MQSTIPDSEDCCVKEDDNPLLIVYVIQHKLPLTAAESRMFHLQASSGLCYSSHFYFLQKCHHFINLARHEIREAVHQSSLPTERTEPCMSPLHSSHHAHRRSQSVNYTNMQKSPFVFQTVIQHRSDIIMFQPEFKVGLRIASARDKIRKWFVLVRLFIASTKEVVQVHNSVIWPVHLNPQKWEN